MEFTGLAQLDEAFGRVVPRKGEMEKAHVSFNKFVEDNIQHALYRDWPDQLTEVKEPTKIKLSPEMQKKIQGSYTVDEIVESMKEQYPDIWK